MNKHYLKMFALLIIIMLVSSIFTSCLKSNKQSEIIIEPEPSKTERSETLKEEETSGPGLPLVKDKITLTMFTTLPVEQAIYFKTINDIPSWHALEEITNIKVDVVAVPEVNYTERKNLLFASRDLTDIIYSKDAPQDVLLYGIEDNLVIKLDELINEHAYYYNQWVTYEPKIKEQTVTEGGSTYYLPHIDITKNQSIGAGYYVREAWLKQLKLDPPTNLEELYNVLKAFKENDLAGGDKTIPFAWCRPDLRGYIIDHILGSYGISGNVYHINNVVKYGPMEPEYREAIKYYSKLYKEKLIRSDYLTYSNEMYNADLLNNIGFIWAWSNGDLRLPLQAAGLSLEDSWNVFRPINGMKGKDGKYYMFDQGGRVVIPRGEFISCTCKHPIEAIKWMDYKYSQEGALTMSWGPRGVTWDYDEKGIPYITDFILKNPNGLTPDEAIYRSGAMEWGYTVISSGFGSSKPTSYWPYTYEDIDFNRNRYGELFESLYSKYWRNWIEYDDSRRLPVTIKYNSEENSRLSVIQQDLNTLIDENLHKIIMGIEPIEKWDETITLMKKMNVEELVSIHQAALDRIRK
jgi:putative aldouronate transport system substrate-binding protein